MLRAAFYKALYTVTFFLANLVLANMLLPAKFGSISLLIVNAAIVYLVTGLGTDGLVMHLLTNKKWNLAQAVSFTRYTLLLQVLLFLLLQFVHNGIWHTTLLAQKSTGFLVSEVFYFAGLVLLEKYNVLLTAEGKGQLANLLLLANGFLYAAVLLFIKYNLLSSYDAVFYVFCLQSFLQGCTLLLAFHWKQKKGVYIRWQRQDVYGVLKMSAVVMVTNFIQFLAYRIDFLLLKHFYSDYEVGVYAQSNKFANLMWVLPNIFAFLLMPKFSQVAEDKVPLLFRYAFLSGLGLLFFTFVITKLFYSQFINAAYIGGLPAFYLMLPGYFCWSVVIYFGAYFSWRGRFYNNLIISSFCFVVILVCDLTLIPAFSIKGAAVSNTIAYTATLVVCCFLFSKTTGMGFSKIVRPQKKDFSLLLTLLK